MTPGKDGWSALNIQQEPAEDHEMGPIFDFQSHNKHQKKISERFLLLVTTTLTIIFCLLFIIFCSLYINEQHKSSDGDMERLRKNREYEFPADPMQDLFEDFDIDVDYRNVQRTQKSTGAMAVTNHGQCSEMAVEVMESGGNAIDAMVAAALCVGLRSPMASGLGGAAFILVRLNNGTTKLIDGKDWAPKNSSKGMYKNQGSLAARIGGMAVAVPMEAKALEKMWQLYGTLEWSSLVKKVIPLARDGYEAHPYLISSLRFRPRSNLQILFRELRNIYLVKESGTWRLPRVGEQCCKRPRLAKTLELLAEQGAEKMYASEWGDQLAKDIQNHVYPGFLSKEDLVRAYPIVRDPIKGKVFGMEMLTATPTSSAVTMITALKLLESYKDGDDPQIPYEHRLIEAMKHMFAIRSHIGDPGKEDPLPDSYQDFFADITSEHFVKTLRDSTNDDRTSRNASHYGGVYGLNGHVDFDEGTSHMSIVDKDGNAVSMTSSINSAFGSYVVSKHTGILLNNLMEGFQKPGLLGGELISIPTLNNFIGPWKRSLSSMSPTMLVKDGKLRLVIGGSGGPLITTSIFQVIANYLQRRYDLQRAIREPRIHDFLNGNTFYESYAIGKYQFRIKDHVKQQLRSRNHILVRSPLGSYIQAIEITEKGDRVGVADPRKDGAACGGRE